MAVKVNESACTACGQCAEACPVEAISVGNVARIDADKCVDCGACVAECLEGALSMDWPDAIGQSPEPMFPGSAVNDVSRGAIPGFQVTPAPEEPPTIGSGNGVRGFWSRLFHAGEPAWQGDGGAGGRVGGGQGRRMGRGRGGRGGGRF